MDFSSKDPKSDLKTACWKAKWYPDQQRDSWLFSNITRPTYLVFHFKASLVQLFFSSLYVKLTEERLHMSLSSPSVISHCLSLFSRPLFSFFSISFLPELCSVAQFFLPEMPQRISLLYLPFFPPFHSLGVSALFLNLSPGLTFSLSPPPSLPLSRDKQGSHLKTQAQHFLFLLYRSSSI